MCKSISRDDLETLPSIVENHHRIKVQFFGYALDPKDHFILHYARIAKNLGPVSHLSTACFESRHTLLKQATKATTSRQQITHTLATKEQFTFFSSYEMSARFTKQF